VVVIYGSVQLLRRAVSINRCCCGEREGHHYESEWCVCPFFKVICLCVALRKGRRVLVE
jgi:hypothetical protein